uniref:Uncharacterized protein n=1 Tax=viral metagenome TaxID=1070528 RepID=A0A6C0KE12_9ZZZZ
MNTRYIEIYSAHRNRNQFPLPSSFDIPFSPTKQLANGSQATDPLVNGAIYYTWNGGIVIDTGSLKTGSKDSSPLLEVSNTHPQPSLPNFYVGYHMMVQTALELQTRIITSYNPSNVAVLPDVSFNGVTNSGQSYIIFDMSTVGFVHLPAVDVYENHIIEYDQAYTGYYVMDETLSYGSKIVARQIKYYDQTIRYAYYDSDMPSDWNVTDSYTLRQSLPLEKWTLSTPTVVNTNPDIGQPGLLLITLPLESSAQDNFYTGKYIYFTTNLPYQEYNLFQSTFKPIYGTYYVVSYTGATRQALCYYDMSGNVTNYPTYPSSNPIVNPPGTVVLKGDTINIVSFTNDNYSPLNYSGSVVSQNQTVCYEIALINLTLPNVSLTTGSRIAFYPYVYVEFANTTSPSGASQNIIYSNNPESGKALFIAAVTDVVQPIISTFVKLDGGNMTQTVKFKPNDSIRFSVYLPDGTQFLPVDEDILSPYRPIGTLQINAVFSIRRL